MKDVFFLLGWVFLLWLPAGFVLESCFDAEARGRSLAERLALVFLLGASWLAIVAIALDALGLLGSPWSVLGATAALVLFGRGRGGASVPAVTRPDGVLGASAALLLAAGVLALWPVRHNAFGADSYFWGGVATTVAAGVGEAGIVEALARTSPMGYGYLLASAAALGVDPTSGPSLVFLGLFWALQAFVAAYALVETVAGRRWAPAGAILYLASYWMLYYLLHSVARQGLALALGPLVLLFLSRRGSAAFGDPRLYVLLGIGWLLHAFTTFVLAIGCLMPFAMAGLLRSPKTAIGGSWKSRVAAAALLAAPVVVVGRFLLELTGLWSLSDAPFKYRMEAGSAVELARTVGPVTIAVLLAGAVALVRRARGPLWTCSLGLLAFLVLVGLFPQAWYKASYVALPPHRYYTFYSFVALAFLAALAGSIERQTGRAAAASRRLAVGATLLALGQLVAAGGFVLRMQAPRPRLEAALEAARWVREHEPADRRIGASLTDEETVLGVVRGVVAPRPLVAMAGALAPEAVRAEAAASGVAVLVTDREELAVLGEPAARFGRPPDRFSVLRLSVPPSGGKR